jgi:hypothetical protein
LPLINTRHLKAQLGRTNGRNVATGASANDDDVELFTHENSYLYKLENLPSA